MASRRDKTNDPVFSAYSSDSDDDYTFPVRNQAELRQMKHLDTRSTPAFHTTDKCVAGLYDPGRDANNVRK